MTSEGEKELYKLWIGNLNPKVTEYSMLKLLQYISVTIEKFDFVYQKGGPDKGKFRGYCFVTVGSIPDAEKIIKFLDGRIFMNRRMSVKPADGNLMKKKKTKYTLVPKYNKKGNCSVFQKV